MTVTETNSKWTPIGRLCQLHLLARLCFVLAAASFSSAVQPQTPSEYEVKATFLYNFAKFVEWPAETAPDGGRPWSLCILGDDPFGMTLERAVNGKAINGWPLKVRRSHKIQDLAGCHILFISSSDSRRLPQIFTQIERGVLTVGESEHFAESGGAIEFFLEDNRVRVAINIDAAQQADLKISSKLLAVARIVLGNNHAREN